MQFADLMRLFREGQNEGRKRGYVSQGACDAEGIAAVVRALRDELGDPSTFKSAKQECCGRGVPNHSNTAEECCCLPDTWLLHEEFLGRINEILAPREGGSREAGGPTREDGRSVEQLAATSSHAVTAPATAPAPAVCEWTPQRSLPDWRLTSCGMVCTEQSNRNGKCQSCGKPIKFTEAK